MPPTPDQTNAARALLREVCELVAEHRDDAVLVGGWVPDMLFPGARPPHVGSIDVDMAMRLNRPGYERLVEILRGRGFHQGENGYQFFREFPGTDGRPVVVRLDLLTSQRHHAEHFGNAAPHEAPEPIRGAEVAFADNRLTDVGSGHLRVAGVVAFLVMKCLALGGRDNEKDAYDIHFCLEHFPDGHVALARLFHPWRGDPLVAEALRHLATEFRSVDDDGPRIVADMGRVVGDARATRKLQAFTRVQEFLGAIAEPR